MHHSAVNLDLEPGSDQNPHQISKPEDPTVSSLAQLEVRVQVCWFVCVDAVHE